MGFLVELWDNQPATVIGAGVVIAVFLGIYNFLPIHIINFLFVKACDTVFKVVQGIAYDRPESI